MSPTNPEPHTPKSRGELLAYAYRRGRELRYRRLLSQATALVMVLSLVSLALVAGDDDPVTVTAVGEGTTTTEATTTTTSTTTTTESSTTTTDASTVDDTTTTTELVCRNSTNPDCGDFYWDPEPVPNTPPEVEILSIAPEQPIAGDEVTITYRVRDAETNPVLRSGWSHVG